MKKSGIFVLVLSFISGCEEPGEAARTLGSSSGRDKSLSVERSERRRAFSGSRAERRASLVSREIEDFFDWVDNEDPAVEGFRENFSEKVAKLLESHGPAALKSLSEGLVARSIERQVPREVCKLLGRVAAQYYSNHFEQVPLSYLLDCSVATIDSKPISMIGEFLTLNLSSKEVLRHGAMELLANPPKEADPLLTAKNIFDKSILLIDPYEIFYSIPDEFEVHSVYDAALSSFIIGEYQRNPEKTQAYLDERGGHFTQRSYLILGHASLSSGDTKIGRMWLDRLTNPRYAKELGKTIRYYEMRNMGY
jgi:hypothetical protein